MEAFEKIQLAFKCPKALDDLQPCNGNWYCDGCQQMVYDFRGKSEKEISDTFAQSGQKLCGIYDANRIKVLPQKRKWYKLIPAAMLMTGLAVCDDHPVKKNHLMGMVLLSPSQTLRPIHNIIGDTVILVPKKEKVIVPQSHLVGAITAPPLQEPVIDTNVTNALNRPIDILKRDTGTTDQIIGLSVTVVPAFPGGNGAFIKYVQKRIKYNAEYQGSVLVSFNVEKDGSLTDVKILKDGEAQLNAQIIDIVEHAPHWMPAIMNGRPCRTPYTIPINIQ